MSIQENNPDYFIQNIGSIVRSLRKERGFSLEELSSKAGISKITLGNIERGEGNPTISVIWKIAKALSVQLMDILNIQNTVNISRFGEGIKISDEGKDWQIEPMFSESDGKLEVYRAYLAPKGTYTTKVNHPNAKKIITVMSGTTDITVSSKKHTLNEYDSISFHANEEHSYFNFSDELCILHLTMIYL
ncbi:putative cupin domain-containing HTH-type transcriptional regulator [Gottschalkia acidurici 9a]|uniref:Cupin domain-containing HTH-type transcriptional regulator n=1 Tax=Gottschalkia acidurici (strain ATCC 7906 / DSM 604 / BCRC 14475 / CIP 104303 / KCTC 5404 / NCIMB 10678 / 9a) TaxID=1128398 RepID=K0AVG7_GOTA9|nr:XRE family transcriptional regulator [Gottschalkia acidurici]AFS77838.1 putative cupin domain-containing HTH-type transcriptional regulator [Gottschalkia acidurici 9a]